MSIVLEVNHAILLHVISMQQMLSTYSICRQLHPFCVVILFRSLITLLVLTNYATIDSITRHIKSSVFSINDNDTDNDTSVPTEELSCRFEPFVSGINDDDTDDDTSVSTNNTTESVRAAVHALCHYSLCNSFERNPDILIWPALNSLMRCTSSKTFFKYLTLCNGWCNRAT